MKPRADGYVDAFYLTGPVSDSTASLYAEAMTTSFDKLFLGRGFRLEHRIGTKGGFVHRYVSEGKGEAVVTDTVEQRAHGVCIKQHWELSDDCSVTAEEIKAICRQQGFSIGEPEAERPKPDPPAQGGQRGEPDG